MNELTQGGLRFSPEPIVRDTGLSAGGNISKVVDELKADTTESFELVLDSIIDGKDMFKITKGWRIDGDLLVDSGIFLEGKITGRLVAPGHVVVVAREGEALMGVECEMLICCGKVGGKVVSSEIILGEDGEMHADEIYVKRGRFVNCEGSEFSGRIHPM
ncbi:hypothetical protein CL689_03650 [Candidatus Saccharibacteria bacterium]|nr:hypothetical protein [Candidatus Saccharibacteria bacterium]|tara:strand:- start:3056 stop:3535 length:480 start_codon:yes stop_codon:yes gene_type:complete